MRKAEDRVLWRSMAINERGLRTDEDDAFIRTIGIFLIIR